jgi:heat shock protein HtpX
VSDQNLNLFEQQAANRRKSWLLVGGFFLFFVWLGAGGDLVLYLASHEAPLGQMKYVHRVPWLAIVMAIVATGIIFDILRNGAQRVLWSTGAVPLGGNDRSGTPNHEERQLDNIVEEMAIASGTPKPKVYIVPDDDPNAFVTGVDARSSHLAVTRGLLTSLDRDELQAVVAHEMGHVVNEDTRLMTLMAGLTGAILLMRDGVARVVFHGGRRRGGGGGGGNGDKKGNPIVLILLVLWVISWILAPLITRLLAMGISRKREYLADAMAAQFTRNPMALATALEKIESASAPTRSINSGVAHLCIADPTGRIANEREGGLADLFATHPPMRNRVARLKAMAFQAQKRAGADLPG